jgi:hypothetical protein
LNQYSTASIEVFAANPSIVKVVFKGFNLVPERCSLTAGFDERLHYANVWIGYSGGWYLFLFSKIYDGSNAKDNNA